MDNLIISVYAKKVETEDKKRSFMLYSTKINVDFRGEKTVKWVDVKFRKEVNASALITHGGVIEVSPADISVPKEYKVYKKVGDDKIEVLPVFKDNKFIYPHAENEKLIYPTIWVRKVLSFVPYEKTLATQDTFNVKEDKKASPIQEKIDANKASAEDDKKLPF